MVALSPALNAATTGLTILMCFVAAAVENEIKQPKKMTAKYFIVFTFMVKNLIIQSVTNFCICSTGAIGITTQSHHFGYRAYQ